MSNRDVSDGGRLMLHRRRQRALLAAPQHSRIGYSDTTARVARVPPFTCAGSGAPEFVTLPNRCPVAGHQPLSVASGRRLRLNTPSFRSRSWPPAAMNFLAQLGSSPRRRPSLPWKQARRELCQRCQSVSNIIGPMAITFTQSNFAACMPRACFESL